MKQLYMVYSKHCLPACNDAGGCVGGYDGMCTERLDDFLYTNDMQWTMMMTMQMDFHDDGCFLGRHVW